MESLYVLTNELKAISSRLDNVNLEARRPSPIQVRYHSIYTIQCLFLVFDIRVFWCSGLRVRAPECQKLKIVIVAYCINTMRANLYR